MEFQPEKEGRTGWVTVVNESAKELVDDKLHHSADESLHHRHSEYVCAAVVKNLVTGGKFGHTGGAPSLEDAKEKGLQLAAAQASSSGDRRAAGGRGKRVAAAAPDGDEPRSPSPSKRRHNSAASPGPQSPGGSPLAYLRMRPGKSAKGKAANAKTKAAASPTKKGISQSKGAEVGKKRKADGSITKQQELLHEANQNHDDLVASIDAVRERFKQDRCDKDLLTAMLTKCARAINYFTSPKHMNLEKATTLQNISEDATAMKAFLLVNSKKSATTKEYEDAFKQCSDRRLQFPSGYSKKHTISKFNSLVDNSKCDDAVDILFDSALTSEELSEICHASVILQVSKCKPQKEPIGKEIRLLLARNRDLNKAMDSKIATNPSHQFATSAKCSTTQMKNLQYFVPCVRHS